MRADFDSQPEAEESEVRAPPDPRPTNPLKDQLGHVWAPNNRLRITRSFWLKQNHKTLRLMNKNTIPTKKSIFEQLWDSISTPSVNRPAKSTKKKPARVSLLGPRAAANRRSFATKPRRRSPLARSDVVDIAATPARRPAQVQTATEDYGEGGFRTFYSGNRGPAIFLISTHNRFHVNQRCSLGKIMGSMSEKAGMTQYRTNRGDSTTITSKASSSFHDENYTDTATIPASPLVASMPGRSIRHRDTKKRTRPRTSMDGPRGSVIRKRAEKKAAAESLTSNESFANVSDEVWSPCYGDSAVSPPPAQTYKATKGIAHILQSLSENS